MKPYHFLSILLALVLLPACSFTILLAPAPTTIPTLAPSATASPSPSPTLLPTSTSTPAPTFTPTPEPALPHLLGYISYSWTDTHLGVNFGPAIYYFDFTQMRKDLGFPSPGQELSSDQSLQLIAALGSSFQGLATFPESVDPFARDAQEQLGWNYTQIKQLLFDPATQLALMRGTFDRKAMIQALERKGYTGSTDGEVEIFSTTSSQLMYFFTQDVIAISIGDVFGQLLPLLQIGGQPDGGALNHGLVQMALEDMEKAWGIVFSPSPDIEAAVQNTREKLANSSPGSLAFIENTKGGLDVSSPNWTFLAIRYRGVGNSATTNTYQLQFIYQYPNSQAAEADKESVRKALTESPSMMRKGTLWSDLYTLESLKTYDDRLIAEGTTRSRNFVSNIVNGDRAFMALPPADPTRATAPAETGEVKQWHGIPIMPDPVETQVVEQSYLYAVQATLEVVEAYYTKEMAALDWTLINRQTGSGQFGPAIILDYSNGDNYANLTLVYSETENYSVVMITVY